MSEEWEGCEALKERRTDRIPNTPERPDSTSSNRAQRCLLGDQAFHPRVQPIARVGYWSYDPVSARFVDCSEMVFEFLGLDPAVTTAPTYDAFWSNVLADDRAKIDREVARALATGASIRLSHRVCDGRGNARWLELHGEAHRAADGSVQRLVGVLIDLAEPYLALARGRMFEALAEVAEVAEDAILVIEPEDATILYANSAADRLIGAAADGRELIGRCARSLWLAGDLCALDVMLDRGSATWAGDVRQLRLDGVVFEANLRLSWLPLEPRPLMAYVARDISDRKRVEAELKRIQFAVDQSSIGVFLLDPQSRIKYVNNAVVQMLGYSREELLTMSVTDIDPIVPAESLPLNFARVRAGGRNQLETLHRRKDGSVLPVEISSNFLSIDGEEYDCCFARDIGERKRAEQALLASRRYLSDLIDALPDALFAVDAQGVVTIWNRAIEQMSGVSRQDVLGRGSRAYAAAFYGEPQPMLLDLALAGRDAAVSRNDGYDFLEWDGDVVLTQSYLPGVYGGRGAYVWGKATALRAADGAVDGALEIIRDITHEKEGERALRVSEARFRSVVSNAPVLMFELDDRGAFRLIEGRGLARLPSAPRALIGTQAATFFGGGEDIGNQIDRALHGEPAQFTAHVDHAVFETFLNPVRDPQSQAASVIGVAIDITERTQRELEIQQRTDELTRFTYAVSHDLKSPLVTILTFLGFLEQDLRAANQERIDKDIGFMRNAAERMTRLLDELLELSRIGRVVSEPTEFSLHEVVQEAVDLVAGRLVKRGATVAVTDRRVRLRGDRRRLVEVFLNLLDNAVKFVGDQPEPKIQIRAESQDGQPVISVSDNGAGIDPRYAHKIFGLFEKLSTGTEGTGIGLTLVERIIDVHGGRIWVESAGVGQGARFSFTLSGTRLEED